jgi:hypothetical protein
VTSKVKKATQINKGIILNKIGGTLTTMANRFSDKMKTTKSGKGKGGMRGGSGEDEDFEFLYDSLYDIVEQYNNLFGLATPTVSEAGVGKAKSISCTIYYQ